MDAILTLIGTGAACPVGVLTWDAWAALRDADHVYGRESLDPGWERALADAGVDLHRVGTRVGPTELARRLLAESGEGRAIVWFGSPDGDPGLAQALTAHLLDVAGAEPPELELVLGSWDLPGAGVLELAGVMHRLRSPGGCPWDAAQTHSSLVPYALEEAFEVAEAVETGSRADLVEELGDLLLQVVFHARLGEDDPEPFDLDDVAAGITAKLRRRHPHVFGDVEAPTVAHVEANWEQIKKAEKARASTFDGIPVALPALARAQKVLQRYRREGIEVPAPDDELSGRVLALVALADRAGMDLEGAVRVAVRRLEEHGRSLEN